MHRSEQPPVRRVVIVEDSPLVRDRLVQMLSSASPVSVVGFADRVDDALAVIDRTQPDAVILDLGLTEGTGFDILERVRDLGTAPAMVVLTNSSHDEYRRRSLELGAVAFLDKSSEFGEVMTTLFTLPPATPGAKPAPHACLANPQCQHEQVRRDLREREARYRALAEATSDAIVVLENGIVREINGPFTSQYGYTESDVVGRPALDFVAPESRPAAAMNIARESERSYRLRLMTKGGEMREVQVTARMHRTHDRTLRLLALHDVTARRQLERQFHQAQKMEAVGRLAGSVAHDFNNVLTAIGGMIELARLELPANHAIVPDLDSALAAVAQGTMLSRQLLNLGRPQPEECAFCDVNAILMTDELMLRRIAGESVVYSTGFAAEPLPVALGAGAFRQCITNLVINARDAMPDGGTLTLETSSVPVVGDVPGLPAGRYVRVSVGDTGEGMSPEVQSRIFEPFFTTKAHKGTGLGLASVWGIVTHAGGTVNVESAPARGTVFELLLPMALPAPASP